MSTIPRLPDLPELQSSRRNLIRDDALLIALMRCGVPYASWMHTHYYLVFGTILKHFLSPFQLCQIRLALRILKGWLILKLR
jgi:hypothetical protein